MKHINEYPNLNEGIANTNELISFYEKIKNLIPEKNLYESPSMDFTEHYLDANTPRTPDTTVISNGFMVFDNHDHKIFGINLESSQRIGKGLLTYFGGGKDEKEITEIKTNQKRILDYILSDIGFQLKNSNL